MIKRIKNKLSIIYKTKIKHQSMSDINNERYRKAGISIGENCIFCSPLPIWRDSFLLSFGNNVLVSGNVSFLLHDAAPTTVSDGIGTDVLGGCHIGNHCFIGANSTIMPGVMLADYTVVGAGSVVTHSTEQPGLVIAGNPARVVCTVKEYINKNSNKIVNLDGMSMDDIRAYIDQNPDKLLKRSSFKQEK